MATTIPADHFHLFTSESVSEGHPDKLADRISDRILDAFLERDRMPASPANRIKLTRFLWFNTCRDRP